MSCASPQGPPPCSLSHRPRQTHHTLASLASLALAPIGLLPPRAGAVLAHLHLSGVSAMFRISRALQPPATVGVSAWPWGCWCLRGLSGTTQRSVRSLGQRLAQTAARNLLHSTEPGPQQFHGQWRPTLDRGRFPKRFLYKESLCVPPVHLEAPGSQTLGNGRGGPGREALHFLGGPSLGFRTLVIKSSGFPGRSPGREKPEFLLPAHL